MPDRLEDAFADIGLDQATLRLILHEHEASTKPRLQRLWMYFRNTLEPAGQPGSHPLDNTQHAHQGRGGWYRLAQEAGLPARLLGTDPEVDDRMARRREVVIENDIAWRIHTMVDFMFGRPVKIRSHADEQTTANQIEAILDAVWDASGGVAMLQDAALLGHVYGHVDLVVRIDEPALLALRPDAPPHRIAEAIRIEPVEPTRAVPMLDPDDYRRILAFVIHHQRPLNEPAPAPFHRRLTRLTGHHDPTPQRRHETITEILTATHRRLLAGDRLIEDAPMRLLAQRPPVAHIQNMSQPFRHEGLGEVEPLIPLQDELNTRLSDRASRVTMQSFNMYLAKGLDGLTGTPVGPGQIWSTDNPDASIQAFGGDAHSPSEEAHVEQIREAMDKVSGVPPLAGGVVRARIGNLSSATALRVTLMGLIAKTARKRITYGRGITDASQLILEAVHNAGLRSFPRTQRHLALHWPDPLPEELRDRIAVARAKQDLGAPPDQLLDELSGAGL